MRQEYNEHDAVCDECRAKKSALYCSWCATYTCTHYSLWANDDELGTNGEQLVHRCNDCENELEHIDVEAETLLREFRIEIQQGSGMA